MAVIQEYDFLLELGADGIKSYTDVDALFNNIREWLLTPQGSVASFPSWGHTFNRFHFHPQGSALNVLVESQIVQKMPRDVYGLTIRGISVDFKDVDLFYVRIDCGVGVFEDVVRL